MVEHGLTEEGRANAHPIKPPSKFAFPPDFDGMGMTASMQLHIAVKNALVDPGFFAIRTGDHHFFEFCVQTNFPKRVAKRFFGAMGDSEFLKREDAARIGIVEPDFIIHRHGKNPFTIEIQKHLGWNHVCHGGVNDYGNGL